MTERKKMIEITADEYNHLCYRDLFLGAMERAGVDYWDNIPEEGVDYAETFIDTKDLRHQIKVLSYAIVSTMADIFGSKTTAHEAIEGIDSIKF